FLPEVGARPLGSHQRVGESADAGSASNRGKPGGNTGLRERCAETGNSPPESANYPPFARSVTLSQIKVNTGTCNFVLTLSWRCLSRPGKLLPRQPTFARSMRSEPAASAGRRLPGRYRGAARTARAGRAAPVRSP